MGRRPLRGMWLRTGRQSGSGSRQLLLSVLLGLGMALFLIHRFDVALRPYLVSLVQTQLRSQLVRISNEAVSDAITRQGLRYSDLVVVDTDPASGISTFTTETVRLNRLRADALDAVITQVEAMDSHCLSVPLGAITGLDVLSGTGPSLPVQVVSVAAAEGEYRNDFTDAGINQTLHRVMLDVTVTAQVLMPGGILGITVSTPVCVAETVIVGQVPQTYLALH